MITGPSSSSTLERAQRRQPGGTRVSCHSAYPQGNEELDRRSSRASGIGIEIPKRSKVYFGIGNVAIGDMARSSRGFQAPELHDSAAACQDGGVQVCVCWRAEPHRSMTGESCHHVISFSAGWGEMAGATG